MRRHPFRLFAFPFALAFLLSFSGCTSCRHSTATPGSPSTGSVAAPATATNAGASEPAGPPLEAKAYSVDA